MKTSNDLDHAKLDQPQKAVLNLVAHWRLAGSNFGSALARDISILFGLEHAHPDTLDRLAMRIASGALLQTAVQSPAA